jgi:hypothetical protein
MIIRLRWVSYPEICGRLAGLIIGIVFLALGLLRLSGRMKILNEAWRPIYLRPKSCLYVFCAIVVGFNLMIAISTALPRLPGEVPSFYYPIAVAAIFCAAILYWAVLRGLQWNWGGNVPLGQKIGFEVRIHSKDDAEELPDSLDQLMREAIADGSRRRVEYKVWPHRRLRRSFGTDINQVSGWLATIAEHTQKTVRLLRRYLE